MILLCKDRNDDNEIVSSISIVISSIVISSSS